jgi:hypothetical protein
MGGLGWIYPYEGTACLNKIANLLARTKLAGWTTSPLSSPKKWTSSVKSMKFQAVRALSSIRVRQVTVILHSCLRRETGKKVQEILPSHPELRL